MDELKLNNDIPLLQWNNVFRTLSLPSFSTLYKLLRFPVQPSAELQQIARDFVICFAKTQGITCPFTPSHNLLQARHTNIDSSQVLLQNVFHRLKKVHFDEMVYEWAIHTHDNYEFKDISSLFALCRLMRECTIVQTTKNGILPHNNVSAEKLQFLVEYWMSIYRNPALGQPDVTPPPMNKQNLAIFHNIVLQFELEQFELRRAIDEIKSSSLTEWDRFIVRGLVLQGWISLEGKFRISLDVLRTIESKLDLKTIENWTTEHVVDYPDLQIPLPSFV